MSRTRSEAAAASASVGAAQAQVLAVLEAILGAQRQMGEDLSLLLTDQRAVAAAVGRAQEPPCGHCGSRRSSTAEPPRGAQEAAPAGPRAAVSRQASKASGLSTSARCGNLLEDEAAGNVQVAASLTNESTSSNNNINSATSVQAATFLTKLAEAEATIGKENILCPAEARAFLEGHPSTLFLDVQDSDAPSVPGTYRASLGQLYFKASSDLPDFRDPIIADRKKDEPILVTCGLGGQAKLGAKLLVDYGFKNVKTVDGGCVAWKNYLRSQPAFLPVNWPAGVARRQCFGDDMETEALEVNDLAKSWPGARSNVQLRLEDLPAMGPRASASTQTLASGREEQPRWVLAPCSRQRIILDLISVCILVYDLVTVPFLLAWDVKIDGWLLAVSGINACFWTFDVFANFRTGFFFHGEVVMRPAMISRRYLKTWFFPDVAMVVLDWVSLAFILLFDDTDETGDNRVQVRMMGVLRFTKWSRILRLVSMARFVRFSDVVERLVDVSFYSPTIVVGFQVCRILFFIIYVNHLGACIWWMIGKSAESNTGSHWVEMTIPDTAMAYLEADHLYQYSLSLHWTVTQILAGSMQVNATNSCEHLFTVACLIFGVLFLSSLVSALAAKMTQLRMLHQDRIKKLSQLREFMRRNDVGPELAVNIVKQVEENLKDKKPVSSKDLLAWSFLSQRNRAQLHRELCRPHLMRHPLFVLLNHIEPKLIRHLCDNAVETVVHLQHDIIFAPGCASSETYYIVKGQLRYTQEPDTSMVECDTEHAVAAGDWVCEAALWTQWSHVGTLEAMSSSELLVLKAQMMAEVVQNVTHARQFTGEFARGFHARVQAARPPHADWPSDISVPYASFQEVTAGMGDHARAFAGNLTMQFAAAHLSWTPWHQRLRQDVCSGRSTVVPTTLSDFQVVNCRVALYAQRADGCVFVQLGTWDGHAAEPACCLPGTRQCAGELPRHAVQRLLRTQLAPLSEVVHLRSCLQEVETKTDSHMIQSRIWTVKHFATLDEAEMPNLPLASRAMEARPTMMAKLSSTGSRLWIEDVFVLSALMDASVTEDATRNLRLYAWVQPAVYERLSSHVGDVRRLLSTVSVGPEVAQEAHRMHYERPASTASDASGPAWRTWGLRKTVLAGTVCDVLAI